MAAGKKLKGFSTWQSNGLIAASTKPPSSDGGGKFIKAAIPIGTKIPGLQDQGGRRKAPTRTLRGKRD